MSNRTSKTFFVYIAELHRAVHAVGLFLDARLGGEVSQAEALIVMHLSERPVSTINEVHRAFLHRRSTLTSVLDRLETKGFVERGFPSADRRSIQVKLTAQGMGVADAIARAFTDLSSSIESAVAIGEHDVTCVRTVAEQASRIAP